MVWSRSSRLFPFEQDKGGYLPVREFTETVVNRLGWKGDWWSLEVFNDSLSEERAEVPQEHAERGVASLRTLKAELEASKEKEEKANAWALSGLFSRFSARASL